MLPIWRHFPVGILSQIGHGSLLVVLGARGNGFIGKGQPTHEPMIPASCHCPPPGQGLPEAGECSGGTARQQMTHFFQRPGCARRRLPAKTDRLTLGTIRLLCCTVTATAELGQRPAVVVSLLKRMGPHQAPTVNCSDFRRRRSCPIAGGMCVTTVWQGPGRNRTLAAS